MSEVNPEFVAIGKILGVQGNHGWLKLSAFSNIPGRFQNIKIVYLKEESGFQGYLISDQKRSAGFQLVKLKGVDSRESAREFTGRYIYLPENQKVKLPADHYFIHDIKQMSVFDEKGNQLGVIKDVLQMGAHDIYVVEAADSEILIPAHQEFIKQISVKDKRVVVRLWEGMR